jgi:CRP-like cAMP-binding protein
MAGASHVLTKTISTTSIVTATPCQVYSIEVEHFNDWLRDHPNLSHHTLCLFAQEIVSTRELVKQMMSSSAEDRLRKYLQEFQELSVGDDPTYRLKQNEVAQLLDMTPEHLRASNTDSTPNHNDHQDADQQ